MKTLRSLLEVESNDKVDQIVDALPPFKEEWFPKSVEAVQASSVFSKPVVSAIFGMKQKDEKKAVVTTLPVDVLEPCQDYLYKKELKDYMRVTPPVLPLVVVYQDRYYVQNHRRVAAQILNGASEIKVRLLKYDGKEYTRPANI